MSYTREMSNGGVDLFGRCWTCGQRVETSGGCTPCWNRRMSEAASTVLTMVESPATLLVVPADYVFSTVSGCLRSTRSHQE